MNIDIEKIEKQINSMGNDAVFADGYDDAVIGIVINDKGLPVVAYSIPKIMDILMCDDDMEYEEAYEWFDFNMLGAYVGTGTPAYLDIQKIIPLKN